MTNIVATLQTGSADLTYVLFRFIGVPVFRENTFTFSLPGVAIEVAEECSGIRSATSLVVGSIVASNFLLQSNWSRALLVILAIPVAVLKNAIRIVTISWLGLNVDEGFFFGNLHRWGGLPFTLIAIAILALLYKGLRKIETMVVGKGELPATR